jgi:hypothetical protein
MVGGTDYGLNLGGGEINLVEATLELNRLIDTHGHLGTDVFVSHSGAACAAIRALVVNADETLLTLAGDDDLSGIKAPEGVSLNE